MEFFMKSTIFSDAINSRNKVRFLYGLTEITLEPYYLARNHFGKKVVYGRVNNSNIIKMFEYEKIFNIKVLDYQKFSAILPMGFAN